MSGGFLRDAFDDLSAVYPPLNILFANKLAVFRDKLIIYIDNINIYIYTVIRRIMP